MTTMSCELFERNLDAYLDSELDEATRAEMNRHCESCVSCAEKLDRSVRLMTMCAEMDEDTSVPLACQAAWRGAIRREAAERVREKRTGRRWLKGVGYAVAAIALLSAGAWLADGSLSTLIAQNATQTRFANTEMSYDYAEEGEAYNASSDAGTFAAAPKASGATAMNLMSDGALGESVSAAPDTTAKDPSTAPMVVRSAQRRMESASFDADLDSVNALVSEYEGYFEESSISGKALEPGQSTGRVSSMRARIPTESLDDFLTSLDAVTDVTYASQSAEDISTQYTDSSARLDSLKAQYKRLQDLVASASDLTAIVELEDKLYEVGYEIDSLEGQLRQWSNQVNYSAVDITLSEVAVRDAVQPITRTLSERARTGFYDSVNAVGTFLQEACVFFAWLAPMLVVIVPAVLLLWLVVHLIRKKHRR